LRLPIWISVVATPEASLALATSLPPRRLSVVRGGELVAKARDASGVATTLIQIGNRKPKRYTKPITVSRRAKVRYWSVDIWGNAERKHRMK